MAALMTGRRGRVMKEIYLDKGDQYGVREKSGARETPQG